MISELTTTTLVEWSRWQFAMTAIYHYMFVPLTLGLSFLLAIMETMWVRTGKAEWLNATKFWMKLFAINFAIGIATGLILEFQFGSNWSNYSWFVGDILELLWPSKVCSLSFSKPLSSPSCSSAGTG